MAAWGHDAEAVDHAFDWLDTPSIIHEREIAAGYPMADFECPHNRLVDCDECERQLVLELT